MVTMVPGVDRYQYQIVGLGMFNNRDRMLEALGELGSQGWDLVATYDKASNWFNGMEKGFLLFKRPVPDGQQPDGPWSRVFVAASEQVGDPW